ncbi:MAG: hypothetical protein ABI165_05075 [Bryobacteraceae bacterium]
MPRMRLALQLRSVEVGIDVDLPVCGNDCLLRDTARLVSALPGGMARDEGETISARNLVLRTGANSLIKRRKHVRSETTPFFGLEFSFDRERHRTAFDLLRKHRPPFISLPMGECECSYEVEFVEGLLPCPRPSMLAAQLASKYRVERFQNAAEARLFVERSWKTLRALHAMGIQHGDPTYYNFLMRGEDAILIDLDDLMYTGAPVSEWDFGVFLLHSCAPVLAEFLPVEELAEVGAALFDEVAAARGGGAWKEFLGLALMQDLQSNHATKELVRTRLEQTAQHIHLDDLSAKLALVGAAAQTPDAPTAGPRSTWSQAEVTWRQQGLRGMRALVEQQESRAAELEVAAAERLDALHSTERARSEMQLEAERRGALLQEMGKRAAGLETAAAERLAALEATDAALQATRAEAVSSQRSLEQSEAELRGARERADELERRLDRLARQDAAISRQLEDMRNENLLGYARRRLKRPKTKT